VNGYLEYQAAITGLMKLGGERDKALAAAAAEGKAELNAALREQKDNAAQIEACERSLRTSEVAVRALARRFGGVLHEEDAGPTAGVDTVGDLAREVGAIATDVNSIEAAVRWIDRAERELTQSRLLRQPARPELTRSGAVKSLPPASSSDVSSGRSPRIVAFGIGAIVIVGALIVLLLLVM